MYVMLVRNNKKNVCKLKALEIFVTFTKYFKME